MQKETSNYFVCVCVFSLATEAEIAFTDKTLKRTLKGGPEGLMYHQKLKGICLKGCLTAAEICSEPHPV